MLNLAEVEVYSFPTDALLELSATAALSSTHPAYPASNCVDGDLNTFCHSANEANPSVTLDLGTAVTVAYVAVYNRNDGCGT
eukprot:scaffold138768_cov193-Phaeocystis_antarctica.AAC.1